VSLSHRAALSYCQIPSNIRKNALDKHHAYEFNLVAYCLHTSQTPIAGLDHYVTVHLCLTNEMRENNSKALVEAESPDFCFSLCQRALLRSFPVNNEQASKALQVVAGLFPYLQASVAERRIEQPIIESFWRQFRGERDSWSFGLVCAFANILA
jgi:hypothetical protein